MTREQQPLCPTCGTSNPNNMAVISEPHQVDGRVTGFTLKGYRCVLCGTTVTSIPIGKPADASPSGAP